MSSRALRALRASGSGSAGGAGVGSPNAAAGPSNAGRTTRPLASDGPLEDASPAPAKRRREGVGSPVASASRLDRSAALPPALDQLRATYDAICFIFQIHTKKTQRSLSDIQDAFRALQSRDLKLDELLQIATVYPGGLEMVFEGTATKALEDDLTVRLPSAGKRDLLEHHKRAFVEHAERLVRDDPAAATHVPCAPLPERPMKHNLEASERIVRKVLKSFSPKKEAMAKASETLPPTIKSFFASHKILSAGALQMVQRSHDRSRNIFDKGEIARRAHRRNLLELPKLFDKIRGLFNNLSRRAMPTEDVVSRLMDMRADRTTERAEVAQQIALLAEHAGEWCSLRKDARNNGIFCLQGGTGSDPTTIRKRLTSLGQEGA